MKKLLISHIISTAFHLGKVSKFPGTIASICSLPICYIIVYFISNGKDFSAHFFSIHELLNVSCTILITGLVISAFLFILGIYAIDNYLKYTTEQDPKEVVIDEIVGQILTFTLCIFSTPLLAQSSYQSLFIIYQYLTPFILFRMFDILKPWPINWVDQNVKGGIGVMLDDVVAALFASALQYAFILQLVV